MSARRPPSNSSPPVIYIFLLTLFEQQVLHLSPLQGGLGYLPLGFGIGAGMGIGTALMPRIGVSIPPSGSIC